MATERSPYYKIIDMIITSKKFLYMENQFFVSNYSEGRAFDKAPNLQDFYFTGKEDESTRKSKTKVHNRVVEALFQRILSAHQAGEDFICCLVLNLMPDFFGDLSSKTDKFRIVIDVTLNTLFKGEFSLIRRLERNGVNWRKYLKVFGLKNHGIKNNSPCCESIYVHSKVIIQDDHELFIGSVNLNDRSLLGNRDSELAVSLVDDNKKSGILSGTVYNKSETVLEFRMKMMDSLIGEHEMDLDDFMDPKLWDQLEKRASCNAKFYSEVFGVCPDDQIRKLTDIQR